ncbi:MAG TPA: TonB-dependent receptor [Opitutaceae bacterium]|nr:TonB-dependent receptor [Opitutaceae bacterium]
MPSATPPYRSAVIPAYPILGLLLALLCSVVSAFAQTSTGNVMGRVFNPATREYMGNAQVRISGTNLETTTSRDGTFSIPNVPAGEVTMTVFFAGYDLATDTFTVTAGQTAMRDISLISSVAPRTATGQSGDTVQLQEFVVASEREGNAKAIMDQRKNMNITTSVATDVFGDAADGNVGEFLKFLPGIDLDYVESETRGPRLGGMDAQYTGVTFDGMQLASADANRTGTLGRATSFEAFSISSIESIEVFRTTSSDMDASSPAGTINMKTRRAFDRAGRRIAYSASVNMNSEEFHFKDTYGPDGTRRHKALPNYSLDYSDVFFNKRLGIVFSHSHANSYTEQYRHNLTFNRSSSAADPRPMVITALNFKDGPKNILKDTYTFTADFKATQQLVLSLGFIYNYALGEFYNRELTFNAASNDTAAATGRQHSLGDLTQVYTDGLSTNTSRNVALAGTNASKRTHTATLIPRFEYKTASWTLSGASSYSRSFNNYEALERGHARSETVNSITSDWIATRPSIQSHEWVLQQTSGADWFNLANFTNPRITNEGRYAKTEIYTGQLDAEWKTPIRRIPTVLKFGGKWAEESRKNGNTTSYDTWSYIGPGGNVLTGYNPTTGVPTFTTTGSSWGAYPNRHVFDTGTTNILTVRNIAGLQGMIPRVDPNAIATLFRDHPEWFVNNATADNYYNGLIAPRRDMVQTVTAGYGMATLRLTDKIQFRGGMRWEGTQSDFNEYDPRTENEVVAAGFPINTTTRRPTSIAGYQYQYMSKPRITRTKKYDDFFPMASIKYNFLPDLEFQAGFNKAIARPPIDWITGSWLVNEDAQRVTGPNPNLLPERSKNFSARVVYYLRSTGQLSAAITQNTIRNTFEERLGRASDFGFGDDPTYANYEFSSRLNIANPVRHRSLELRYEDNFRSFPLPEYLRGISYSLSYTRSYASERRPFKTPHIFTTNAFWRYKRLMLRSGVVARADTPWDGNEFRYRRHHILLDVGGEFRINKYATLFFSGRNILNESMRWYESPYVEGEAGALRILENYGSNWVFGVRGTF